MKLKLLHITEAGADVRTEHSYENVEPHMRGTFGLIEQHGEMFDRPGQIAIELEQSIPSGSHTAVNQTFPILQGPFPEVSQQVVTDASPVQGVEEVVFARCMSNSLNHSFGADTVEHLTKHAAETKDVIIVLTLRWDP